MARRIVGVNAQHIAPVKEYVERARLSDDLIEEYLRSNEVPALLQHEYSSAFLSSAVFDHPADIVPGAELQAIVTNCPELYVGPDTPIWWASGVCGGLVRDFFFADPRFKYDLPLNHMKRIFPFLRENDRLIDQALRPAKKCRFGDFNRFTAKAGRLYVG